METLWRRCRLPVACGELHCLRLDWLWEHQFVSRWDMQKRKEAHVRFGRFEDDRGTATGDSREACGGPDPAWRIDRSDCGRDAKQCVSITEMKREER